MIQFNLLPDVKINYLKTQKTKRLVMLVSIGLAGVSLLVLVLMFSTVQIVQKKSLSDVTKDIDTEMKTLKSVEDLNKILTIQNQLTSLTSLHDSKMVTSRLFGYIATVTPIGAKIAKLDVDFAAKTMTISGTADTPATINRFADSFKFATYEPAAADSPKPFTAVVTTPVISATNKPSYTITLTFAPSLFSNTVTPVLSVPDIISNRSTTEKPTAIFKNEQPAKVTN